MIALFIDFSGYPAEALCHRCFAAFIAIALAFVEGAFVARKRHCTEMAVKTCIPALTHA
jgi:hypothetical protein